MFRCRLLMRFLLAVCIPLFLASCTLVGERKPRLYLDASDPYRCGIYFDYHFEGHLEEYVYPDLGILLANHKLVGMEPERLHTLRKAAADCYQKCHQMKEKIHTSQVALRQKAKRKPGLKVLLPEFQKIEAMKKQWLQEHATRYYEALHSLDAGQRLSWSILEKEVRPFPETEK